MQSAVVTPRAVILTPFEPFTLDDLERSLMRSRTFAWALIVGLPALGILSSLVSGLPVFAALMAGSFLLVTALTCRKALTRFTSRTLRLLVAARLVIVLVVGALLFCATGTAWAGMVSALLLWLVADRLLGQYGLNSLRNRGTAPGRTPTAAVIANRRSLPVGSEQTVHDSIPASDSLSNGDATRLFANPELPADAAPRRRGRRHS